MGFGVIQGGGGGCTSSQGGCSAGNPFYTAFLASCSDHISTVSVQSPSVRRRCSCIRWREVTIFFSVNGSKLRTFLLGD